MSHRLEARVALVASWLLLGAALCSWWSLLELSASFREQYFTADLVTWPAVIEDVLVRGHPFRHAWHLTPAPSFVPDAALALAARATFATIEARQYAAIVGQVVLIALALSFFCSRLGPGLGALGPAVTAAFVALAPRGEEPFTYVLYPTYHAGVAVLAPLALGLAVGPRSRRRDVLLALTLAGGTASDALLPIFVLGGLAAAAVALPAPRRARLGSLAWALAGAAGGWPLGRLVPFPDRAQHSLRLSELTQTLAQAWAHWLGFAPTLRWLLPLGVLACTVLAVRSRDAARRWVALSLLGGTTLTLGAIVLTGNLVEGGWVRYLLWPCMAALVGLLALVPHAGLARWLAVAIAAGALLAQPARPAWPLPTTAPPSALRRDVACLDALAARAGAHGVLAGYWQTKPLALFSATGLSPAQFTADLGAPALWITSRHWYWPADGFALAVVEGLDAGALDRELGAAFTLEPCGAFHVRRYEGEARARLTELLTSRARAAMGGRP